MRLIMMRHAKSDWSQPNLSDHDRALNVRGGYAAPRMARHLLEQSLEPELVLASTAVRVQQTLGLMREQQWASEARVEDRKDLYLATPQHLAKTIEKTDTQCKSLMLIGHNPGMCSLL